ncbi:hypothetical protein OS493_029633 [Desmophyllum pertusum]|uniref:CUB domain-containing protein n=1 Tax=Desmophyllum pertusum TaxID=174260 RepID=A0A9W9ZXK6_9CNID|nr:hypothetical protein OS493_029633 [Desmophyllum pertusum]
MRQLCFAGLICLLLKPLTTEGCSINSTLDAPQSPANHTFSSPSWPQGYPVNMTCGWYITAPEDHIVMLQLTSQLSSSHSSKDSVEVYDVESSELSLITIRLALQNTSTVFSKFRSLYILFTSDDKTSPSEQGIFATYTAISTGKG